MKAIDELAVFCEVIEPENNDGRELVAARQHKRHVAGRQALFESVEKIHFYLAFEVEHFHAAARCGGDDERGAEHGSRGGTGVDCAAALAVRRVEQQAALLEVDCAVRGVEGENGVSADAGHRFVRRDEFRAGRWAGFQNVWHGENVIHARGFLFLVSGGNDLDVVHDLRDFGLLQVKGAAGGNGKNAAEA